MTTEEVKDIGRGIFFIPDWCYCVPTVFSNLFCIYLQGSKVKQADVGKFFELPGAEMGKVVVRFPPEASG
jgi:hypothetical protein